MLARPTFLDYAGLLLISLMWGSSFMFTEIAIRDFPPFTLAAFRIVISALLLWALAIQRGYRLPTDRAIWKSFFVIGFFALIVPFSSISWAQQELTSSTAAIVMAFTPLLTVMFAHLMTRDERLTRRRALGLMVGMSGVVLLFGGASIFSGEVTSGPPALSLFAMFIGPVGYAYSSILIKDHRRLPPMVSTLVMMIAASVMIVPLAVIVEMPDLTTYKATSFMAATFLGLASTALGGVIMIWIINRVGVTFMSLNNYLVPAIGVIWGALLLGEAVRGPALAAFGLILTGVAIASIRPRAQKENEV